MIEFLFGYFKSITRGWAILWFACYIKLSLMILWLDEYDVTGFVVTGCTGVLIICVLPDILFMNLLVDQSLTESRGRPLNKFYDLPLIGCHMKTMKFGWFAKCIAWLKCYFGSSFEATILSLFEVVVYLSSALFFEQIFPEVLSVVEAVFGNSEDDMFFYTFVVIIGVLWTKIFLSLVIFCDGLARSFQLYGRMHGAIKYAARLFVKSLFDLCCFIWSSIILILCSVIQAVFNLLQLSLLLILAIGIRFNLPNFADILRVIPNQLFDIFPADNDSDDGDFVIEDHIQTDVPGSNQTNSPPGSTSSVFNACESKEEEGVENLQKHQPRRQRRVTKIKVPQKVHSLSSTSLLSKSSRTRRATPERYSIDVVSEVTE